MFTLASHPDYRGRGIATELVNQALKVDQNSVRKMDDYKSV